MQLTIEQTLLEEIITAAASVLAKGRVLAADDAAITLSARAGRVTASGTNRAQWIVRTVDAQVEKPGDVKVHGRDVVMLVGQFERGDVEVSVVDGHLVLAQGDRQYRLFTIACAEDERSFAVPVPADHDAVALVTLASSDLRTLVNRTAFAVSTLDADKQAPFGGVLLEGRGGVLRAVSTNRHRLVRTDLAVPDGATAGVKAVVPVRPFEAARRLKGPITIHVSADFIWFLGDGEQVVTTVQPGGDYPNIEHVLNAVGVVGAQAVQFVAARTALVHSLERLSVVSRTTEEAIPGIVARVKMEVTAGMAMLSGADKQRGWGRERVPLSEATVTGVFANEFNAELVVGCLSRLAGESVRIGTKDADAPMVLTADGDTATIMLVLPLRTMGA